MSAPRGGCGTWRRRPLTLPAAGVLLAGCLALSMPSRTSGAELTLELVASDLEIPVDLRSPPGDPRLFVVEKVGRIRIIENGRVLPQPFLDIHDQVSRSGEQGLLGLAFHPDYPRNGLLFVDYTDRNGDTRVVRYHVAPGGRTVDPGSRTLILSVEQPYSNHNGGQVLFGPDGMLYIPLGDGGSGGDPHGNGQNLGTLLGKLLRIDVNGKTPYAIPPDNPFVGRRGARPEIWAYGLRNPWRIAFDSTWVYIADVGQDRWEEVDVAPWRRAGINYGWNLLEGTHPFHGGNAPPGSVLPVAEYSHDDGCSVTGGRVYHGPVQRLRGLYFYADYCAGWISTFRYVRGVATERTVWKLDHRIDPTAFGEDSRRQLYVLDFGGRVYRIAGVR